MTRCLRYCVVTLLLGVTPAALASFHLFRIEQLYSNADRSVQFIVMHQTPSANGEDRWEGQRLTSTSPGSPTQSFTFPADLPGSFTGGSSSGLSGTIVLRRVGPVPKGCTT